MITFELSGQAGIYLKYEGDVLDVVNTLPSAVLNPVVKTFIRFTAGVATLVKGVLLLGGTSGATCQVDTVVVTKGTLAGSNGEGVVFLRNISGTIQDGENLGTGATVQAVSRSTLQTLPSWVSEVGSVLLQIETNAVRILYDGSNPTNSTETGDPNYGILLNPTDSIQLKGWINVSKLKFINAVAANNGVVNLVLFYGRQG
jgi:hypothetical protein